MAKRGRKPKEERKGYFYEREEQAVIDYNNAETAEEKDAIYNEILEPAFKKMIESIIRRYKLFVPDEEFEENFNDTLSFLMTKLSYFNPERGKKAYSYFGNIAKNYLLYKVQQYSKNLNRNSSYEDMADDIKESVKYSEETDEFAENAGRIIDSLKSEITKMTVVPDEYHLSPREILVGKALCELFDNWESVIEDDGSNKLNKSSVLLFLREQTLMETKEIRDSMKPYKNVYKIVKRMMLS